MKSIVDLKVNDIAYIKKINLEKDVKQRLQDLGLHIHAKVLVFNKTNYDSIIIIDDYTKITLGNEVAKNIFII